MTAKAQDAWLFIAEWFDPMPQMKKTYLLKYFIDSHEIEMIDVQSKKMFLKRSPCPPEIKPSDYFIGGKLLLYSRELTIVDFGDMKTKKRLEIEKQRSVVILPSSSYNNWGLIVDEINAKFTLQGMQTVGLFGDVAGNIADWFGLTTEEVKGLTLVGVFHGENGVESLYNKSLELSEKYNCIVLAPDSTDAVEALVDTILQPNFQSTTATLNNCTCAIIKPHAVKENLSGRILQHIINDGYDISAVSSVMFDRTTIEELLEVYKGVVPEFPDHVVQLSSGVSIICEIRAEDAVNSFRQTCGPWDAEIAQKLRPTSIRALYGTNRVRNAIHCTDLDTDGANECEYCFYIMSSVLSNSNNNGSSSVLLNGSSSRHSTY